MPPPVQPPRRSRFGSVLRFAGLGCGGLLALIVLLVVAAMIFSPSSPSTSEVGKPPEQPVFSKSPVPIPTVEIPRVSEVDERLFLVRLLEEIYSEWPRDTQNRLAVQKALGDLRYRASRHHEYIGRHGFDPELKQGYEDVISAIESYTQFLARIGEIEAGAVARAEKEAAETGFNAGFAGGDTAFRLKDSGASGTNSLLAGAAVAGLSFLWEDYNKGKERDAAKQRAIDVSSRELNNTLSSYLARSQNMALELANRYSWTHGEGGFDRTSEENARWEELVKANDAAGLLRVMDRLRQTRAHDPFAQINYAYFASRQQGRTAKDLAADAQLCLTAAALVPANAMYDEYRGWCLYRAGDIANLASTVEIGRGSWARAFNATAAHAVGIWDACLRVTPNDPTGELGERRAWALLQSGHLSEALEQARAVESVRNKDLRFAYNYSTILSCTGDTQKSFEWLNYAIRGLGYSNIKQAIQDPDLETMRKSKKAEFDDLVAIKIAWKLNYGIFNDDVLLTNLSAFPLTNVVLSGRLSSQGKYWSPQLKTVRLNPNQVTTWSNVLSIPGSHADPASVFSCVCDQGTVAELRENRN